MIRISRSCWCASLPSLAEPTEAQSKHFLAVLALGGTALIWGGTFAATAFALSRGLSVNALLALRFTIGGAVLGLMVAAQRLKPTRRELLDGLWLGLVVATLFWFQTDGLRLTTTAKSAFITGLYVVFTPMVSLVVGDRLKGTHALSALVALGGLMLLVYQPGLSYGGWNRGDSETLLTALLAGIHMVMTGHFSRRSRGWILAFIQVSVVAVLLTLTALASPAPYGFHGAGAALRYPGIWISLLFLSVLATSVAFYLQSTMQAYVGATEAAILFSMEPVFAGIIAVVGWVPGIHEHLEPRQWAGAAFIIGATLLAEIGPRLMKARRGEDAEAIG